MTITLIDLLTQRNMAEVARLLGVSRAAVSQMRDSGREIFIDLHPDGSFKAWEKRPIPARSASTQSAA